MSPDRTSKNGQYRTDWYRKEVGRIRVTYGYTEKEHAKAVHLLDELYDNDQLEVLRALAKKKGDPGRVEIRELIASKKAKRHKRSDLIVDVRLQRPLWVTLETMITARGGSTNHLKVRASHLRKFARAAGGVLGVHATIADLHAFDFKAVRGAWGGAADWNHFRKLIGATLSELLGSPDHEFRREVMKRIAREREIPHDVDITVEQFWGLVALMPEPVRPVLVTLAVTGMRVVTEYLQCTEADKRPETHAIYCPGSKNADAAGLIPVAAELWDWVDAGIPAPRKIKWIRQHFHRAAVQLGLGRYEDTGKTRMQRVRRDRSGPPAANEATGAIREELPVLRYKGITLHDLRHLSLQLALDGGAAINDVQSFARHADPAMTMRYLKRAGRRRAATAIGKQLLPKKEA